LNELIKRKNEVLQKRATPSMFLKSDLKKLDLSNLGKFDVILIDPPLPEYQRRVEGQLSDTSHLDPWSFEEIANLRIDLLADQCCFLFLWVGSSEGLDKGRALIKKWNFRRCEDIVWIKTNKHNFNRRVVNDKDTLLVHTKEHCLVGIKGAVKRGVDGHFIHANIDTDVIVAEEPLFGFTEKPQELYRIIERFCLGRKRIELFGEDHNIRPGWLTLGKSLSSSNLDIDTYKSFFEGELCYPEVQGYKGGRYVGCTQEIESLRPRSPTRNNNSIINPLSNNMGMINSSGFSYSNNSNAKNLNPSANISNFSNNFHQSNYMNSFNGNNQGHSNNSNYRINNSHGKSYLNNNNSFANSSNSNNKNQVNGVNNYNHTNSNQNQYTNSASNFFNNTGMNNYNNSINNSTNFPINKSNFMNNGQQMTNNYNNFQGNSSILINKHNHMNNGNHNFARNGKTFENSNPYRANSNMSTGMKPNNHFEKANNNLNFNINNSIDENMNLNNLSNNYNQNS